MSRRKQARPSRAHLEEDLVQRPLLTNPIGTVAGNIPRIDTLAIWRRPPWNAHVDPTSRGFYEERISGVTSQDLQIFTRNADVLPSSSSAPINEEACCLQNGPARLLGLFCDFVLTARATHEREFRHLVSGC
ncbi:uncharacterized protein LOC143900273 [Temnothorax americanus]|uniref:uncharacterized protein LOC143900273 n=1 Tax=Temnothorax americanus TaxID=1964332 RepID=UPI0040683756